MSHAGEGCASNLTERFMDEISTQLKDVLVPYLSARELARLATTCRLFRTWASGARRVKLGLERAVDGADGASLAEDAWKPHGHLGEGAVLCKRRMIRARMRMYTLHPNPDGVLVEHEVPPGRAVVPHRTRLRVQLVRRGSGLVEEELYDELYWKNGDWGAGETADDPKEVKFFIRHTLSSKRRPPAKFRLRFTLEVVRHGTEEHVHYRYETPEFLVIDPDAFKRADAKRKREADAQR